VAAEFFEDLFPAHEELREAGPAVRLSRYSAWAVAHYAEKTSRPKSLVLETDPPLHDKTRRVAGAANRDPRPGKRPDDYDISRRHRPCRLWQRQLWQRHPPMRRPAVGAARRRVRALSTHPQGRIDRASPGQSAGVTTTHCARWPACR